MTIKETGSTASEKLDWALHPRRSELPYETQVKDPFEHGSRPGLGGQAEPKGK
jgi:hypothetical protein